MGGVLLIGKQPFLSAWANLCALWLQNPALTAMTVVLKWLRALRDAGHEVIYTGLRRSAQQIVDTVRDEDARFLGLSSLSGAHGHLFPKVCELLRSEGLNDVIVFGGGIIPEDDRQALYECKIRAIFGPGTPTSEILEFIQASNGMDDAGIGQASEWHWSPTA